MSAKLHGVPDIVGWTRRSLRLSKRILIGWREKWNTCMFVFFRYWSVLQLPRALSLLSTLFSITLSVWNCLWAGGKQGTLENEDLKSAFAIRGQCTLATGLLISSFHLNPLHSLSPHCELPHKISTSTPCSFTAALRTHN